MSLSGRWSALLDRLRTEGRYRELSLPQGVDLASNDYLGYGGGCRTPPLVVAGGGWRVMGPTTGHRPPATQLRSGMASRLLRGHQVLWDEVETALARWHGAEAALMLTSGYTANEGLLATVIEPHDWVASDALNHASIIDGLRLAGAERFVYRHLDLNHLEAGLRAAFKARTGQ